MLKLKARWMFPPGFFYGNTSPMRERGMSARGTLGRSSLRCTHHNPKRKRGTWAHLAYALGCDCISGKTKFHRCSRQGSSRQGSSCKGSSLRAVIPRLRVGLVLASGLNWLTQRCKRRVYNRQLFFQLYQTITFALNDLRRSTVDELVR